jgi:hypothetical protein
MKPGGGPRFWPSRWTGSIGFFAALHAGLVCFCTIRLGEAFSITPMRFLCGRATYGNAPYLYAQQPNAINLHQLDLHAIRLPDTYQIDHIDWCFRVDALDGMDYRFPTMKRHFHRVLP